MRPTTPVQPRTNKHIAHDDDSSFDCRLIIPTYKHVHLLEKLLNHLTHPKPPPSLAQIVIVWLNVGTPTPDYLQPDALAQLRQATGVPVSVRLSQRNSKNEQFRPLKNWGVPITTRAVMVLEDNLVLRKETIEWGWHEWVRQNPPLSRRVPRTGRLVGFQGKDWHHHPHRASYGEEWEFTRHPEGRVGLILTSGAWIKTEWLEQYWDDNSEMIELRNYVDSGKLATRNGPAASCLPPLTTLTMPCSIISVRDCEDLLFNFLAANLSRTAPLLLQPTHPLRTAASADLPASDHFNSFTAQIERDATRSHCLARFFTHFAQYAPDSASPGHFPLKRAHSSASQDLADHAREMWDDEEWEEEEEPAAAAERPKEAIAMIGSGVGRVRGEGGGEVVGHGEWRNEGDKGEKKDDEEGEEDDDDDDDDDEEEEGDDGVTGDYSNQWEALLSDMTDEEVAELMAELALHHELHPNEDSDGAEEDGEGEEHKENHSEEHHRDEL